MASQRNVVYEEEYKRLLGWLNDSIRSTELEDIKLLLDIADGEAEGMTSSTKVFEHMEGEGGLSPSNTTLLIDLLNEIGRKDLANYVLEYEKKRPEQTSISSQLLPPSYFTSQHAVQNSEDVLDGFVPCESKQVVPCESERMLPCESEYDSDEEISQKEIKPSQTIPHYKMSSEPRGQCLIISNADFSLARSKGKPLNDRPGTENDLKMLESTFKWLKFDVKCFSNLHTTDMYKTLNRYAMEVDHTDYDCFVCCILTHGNDSGLYGVDGLDLKISNITMLYEPVPSLYGKPKLFFFQACRGVAETRPYTKDDFGDENDDSTSYISQYAASPLGSDFFIGYATPPGYAAWIGAEGSWYISALCEALNNYADRYDLQHISTEINNIVSRFSSHRGDKQIPNPTFTLRKILYFFPEKVMS